MDEYMKKVLSLLLIVTMTVALFAACGKDEGDSSTTSTKDTTVDAGSEDKDTGAEETDTSEDNDSDVIKVGTMGAYSGDYAQYGLAVRQAAELAISEVNAAGGVNGKNIELVAYDNEGDPTKSINLFNRMVDEDGIIALVGPVFSGVSLVVAELCEEKGIPMLTPTATNKDVTIGYDYVFRACFIDPYQGKVVAKFANDNLGASTAIIFENVSSDYSIGLAEAFEGTFEGELSIESYTGEDNDFNAIISSIKDTNPDVIFIPDYFDKVGLIAKQLNQAGVDAILLGGDGWDGVQGDYAAEVEGDFFSNHYTTTDESEIVQSFIADYEAQYDSVPNALAALGYDGMQMMAQALISAGSTDGAAIRDALSSVEYDGVTGHTVFDENGDTFQKVASIIRVQDGELVLETKMSE